MYDSANFARLIILTIIASLSCFAGIAFIPYSLMRVQVQSPAPFIQGTDVSGGIPSGGTGLLKNSTYETGQIGREDPSVNASPETSQKEHSGYLKNTSYKPTMPERTGYLRICEPDIEVALCSSDVYTKPKYTQEIVDLEDRAAFFRLWGRDNYVNVIADHEGQAFTRLSEVRPGAGCTISHEITGKTPLILVPAPEEYVCQYSCEGTNSGRSIFLDNGSDITSLPRDTLIIYTCHGDWEHVIITVWKKKSPGFSSGGLND